MCTIYCISNNEPTLFIYIIAKFCVHRDIKVVQALHSRFQSKLKNYQLNLYFPFNLNVSKEYQRWYYWYTFGHYFHLTIILMSFKITLILKCPQTPPTQPPLSWFWWWWWWLWWWWRQKWTKNKAVKQSKATTLNH